MLYSKIFKILNKIIIKIKIICSNNKDNFNMDKINSKDNDYNDTLKILIIKYIIV